MKYLISQTEPNSRYFYKTNIYINNKISFAAFSETAEQSRLNAVKLAMLLAIQESEKLLKNKTR